MTVLSLKQYPWQTVACVTERFSFEITVFSVRGLMYAIVNDGRGNRISGPVRCCSGQWLISGKARNYSGAGNFVFVTPGDDYPHFLKFGESCELRYYSQEEMSGGYREV